MHLAPFQAPNEEEHVQYVGQCDNPGCEARVQQILPAGMRSLLDETRC